MARKHLVGELQLEILRVLWRGGGQTVLAVHEALADRRSLSPNTIGSMLQKMERKGIVQHQRDGRRYIYSASVSEAEVRRSMVADLVRQLFAGDSRALVGHLMREEEIGRADLEALRGELERKREEGRR